MTDVEIVATYELYNINRSGLEHILHKFFNSAKLDIQINDRFGNLVTPQEWFFIPLFIIDETVEKIKARAISEYIYDTESVSLVSVRSDCSPNNEGREWKYLPGTLALMQSVNRLKNGIISY